MSVFKDIRYLLCLFLFLPPRVPWNYGIVSFQKIFFYFFISETLSI